MSTTYKPYEPDQPFLLPPSLKEWLPQNHLAYFISDVVDELDLRAIEGAYSTGLRGQPPYHPVMMVKLLFYAYCMGVPSSRKIERKTFEDIAFRILAAGHHPDHDTLASFRRMHLPALKGLFLQVFVLRKEAGLAKAGHIALDGTKMKANASKHKAMSYGRMGERERELAREIDDLLKRAEDADAREDAQHGKGRRGDDVPEELAFREQRLKKIKEAKGALEQRTKEKGKDVPLPKDQINFTDAESRIMKDGATKVFIQGYNAQAVVDTASQLIIAADVTTETNDKQQIEPMVKAVIENLGKAPKTLAADAGYFSEDNLTFLRTETIEAFIPPGRMHRSRPLAAPRGRILANLSLEDRMRRLLATVRGKKIYGRRKETVEPVFGQIKDERGFRRFLLRGHEKVKAEWTLICLTHNVLKLYRWELKQAPT
jgi:transposase